VAQQRPSTLFVLKTFIGKKEPAINPINHQFSQHQSTGKFSSENHEHQSTSIYINQRQFMIRKHHNHFLSTCHSQLQIPIGERAAELAKKAKDLPPPSRGISMDDVPWKSRCFGW
jgi:hypothetical protein